MLLPNLVWRAGRVAEQVRLAAMLCVSRLLPRGLISPTQLQWSQLHVAAAAHAHRPQGAVALLDEQSFSGLDACSRCAALPCCSR